MYSCGNSIGFSASIGVQFYDLPRFQTSSKPQVSDSQSDQLTVTWNKWTTDDIGDGPVESYKVYYRGSGESDWISGQVIPFSDSSQMIYTSTITGLHWSTEYEITVTVKRPGPLGEGSKDTTITATTLCATGENTGIITEGENKVPIYIGCFAAGVVVTILFGVPLLYLIRRMKSHKKHKERNEIHDDIPHAGNDSREMRDSENIHEKENDHYQGPGRRPRYKLRRITNE
ncbi:uncharacterized protein LOC144341636 [Saccoglossus kowalevskii]